MSFVARRARIIGQVQGVGFRHYAKVRARELALTGWVRNLPDGSVEAWIEGQQPSVDAMITWLRRGPTGSHVDDVAIESTTPANHERFVVRFD